MQGATAEGGKVPSLLFLLLFQLWVPLRTELSPIHALNSTMLLTAHPASHPALGRAPNGLCWKPVINEPLIIPLVIPTSRGREGERGMWLAPRPQPRGVGW